MTYDHSDKVAFITGAGAGIGRGAAIRLADEGASIIVTDIDLAAAEETCALIERTGGKALPLKLDVRDVEAIKATVATGKNHFERIDFLVNNAGVVTRHSATTMDEESWDFVMDINLKGQFFVGREVALAIREGGRGGAMVNLSTVEASVVATSTGAPQPHYNASKGGVPMLTKALAVEFAPDIRVNCVAPGAVATNFFDYDRITAPETLDEMKWRLLVGRIATPADIAAAISFLLSSEASYIDGIELIVDGGILTQ